MVLKYNGSSTKLYDFRVFCKFNNKSFKQVALVDGVFSKTIQMHKSDVYSKHKLLH